MSVRIVEVREITKPISSPIRNAYIDFSQDDDEPRRGRDRRGARRHAGRRLRLQLERPLRPGRAHPRALRATAFWKPKPASLLDDAGDNLDPRPRLGRDDEQRKAGRPWRALGRGRHASTWRCGMPPPRSQASRCSACWPSVTASRPIRASSSMRRAATTIRARTTTRCAPRCAAISIAATTS